MTIQSTSDTMTHRAYIDVAGLALPTASEINTYPLNDIQPHPHQKRLYSALTNESIDERYYINGAPTGSGKTLSWVAPVLAEERDAIAMYPTNALINDQSQSIQTLVQNSSAFGSTDLETVVLTGETVDSLQKRHDTNSRAMAIEIELRAARKRQKQTGGAVVVLTNPDMLVLMYRDLFGQRLKEIIHFDLLVADEFHRASRKEQNTLRYTLEALLDDQYACARHVVYLSATTEDELVEILSEESPYPVTTVESATVPFLHEVPENHRAIMPPVRLQLTPHETFSLGRHLNKNAFLEQAVHEFTVNSRSAIILDGVREVETVHQNLLSPAPFSETQNKNPEGDTDDNTGVYQQKRGITSLDAALGGNRIQSGECIQNVNPDGSTEQPSDGENQSSMTETGKELTITRLDGFRRPENLRTALNRFDVLISNSAVEVGIDFDLDRLLFSAAESDSLIQRIGRLRTSEDWHAAWGLVPEMAYTLENGTGVIDALREAGHTHDEFEQSIDHLSSSSEAQMDHVTDRPETHLAPGGPPLSTFTPTIPTQLRVAETDGYALPDKLCSLFGEGETDGRSSVDAAPPLPFAATATTESLGVVSRAEFERAVIAGYPNQVSAPDSFDWEFSAVEAMKALTNRCGRKEAPDDAARKIRTSGVKRIKRQFYDPHDDAPAFDKLEQKRLFERRNDAFAADLMSYRGDGVAIAVYHVGQNRVFNYQLPYVLRYGNVEFTSETIFYDRVNESHESEKTVDRIVRYTSGYCLFHDTIPPTAESRDLAYIPGKDGTLVNAINSPIHQRRPVRASVGVRVSDGNTTGQVSGLGHLKTALENQEFLCYVTPQSPHELSETYPLPKFMFVYPFSITGQHGSITFGHDALYLYAHLRKAKK